MRKEVINGTLDADLAKLFDINTAADTISKELLTCSSSIAPIATFVRHKKDSLIAGQNSVVANLSRKGPAAVVGEYGDIIEEVPSQSDSESGEPHHSRSSRGRSKDLHANLEDRHLKDRRTRWNRYKNVPLGVGVRIGWWSDIDAWAISPLQSTRPMDGELLIS